MKYFNKPADYWEDVCNLCGDYGCIGDCQEPYENDCE